MRRNLVAVTFVAFVAVTFFLLGRYTAPNPVGHSSREGGDVHSSSPRTPSSFAPQGDHAGKATLPKADRERSPESSSIDSLVGLKNLRVLDVRATRMTPEGVARLQKALPDCRIGHDG